MAGQVEGEHLPVSLQARPHIPPGAMVATKSVQQNDRRPVVATTATAEVKACHAGKPYLGIEKHSP